MPALRHRLVLLFLAGVLLLNFPLLSLFDREVSIAGVPLLYAAIFAVWIGLIAATAVLLRRRSDDSPSLRD